MASSPLTLARQQGWFLWSAVARLAVWRFKQMWRFLFVTWLGMLAMVVLACAPSLFSRVAISADLRSVAANSPDGQRIIVRVVSLSPTSTQVQQIGQQLDQLLRLGSFGVYIQGPSQIVVQSPPLSQLAKGVEASQLVLDGYDPAQVAPHVTILQGRLPQETNGQSVEIAITQQVAMNLNLHVDSLVQEYTSGASGNQVWLLHVVGIIAPPVVHDVFWLGAANPFGSLYTTQSGFNAQSVLAPVETVRAKIAALQTLPGKDASQLYWSYPFNPSHLDANNIPALSQQANDLEQQVYSTLTQISGVSFASPGGSLFATLQNYNQQLVTLEIVITFLLLLILAIILFLVGMMSDVLVERQAAIIATLRSRGATQRHIFGAFAVQGLLIGLAALLIGPFLAILLVYGIAQMLLTPANQQSLSTLSNAPLQAVFDVKWFAVIAVVVALFVMLLAIGRSAKLDILTLRRESSRVKHIPFWRRFNLDVMVSILIVAGYLGYDYFWQTLAAARAFDPILFNILKIGAFIAPPLLVATLLMLFLRFFPVILRLVSKLAAKRPAAPAILAFAQMERVPRPAARVIILLALTIAATCFLGTLMMTKQARTVDAAAFDVGADFSGPLPTTDSLKTFDTLKTQYSTLTGVQSATVGYINAFDDPAGGDLNLVAVDASTYAHTAIWTAQNSSQSLSLLMKQLVAHRPDATTHDVVYALVDAALWQQFGLSQGSPFTLTTNDAGTLHMHFIALAQINVIPGNYDTPLDPQTGGGILVDYQSYATVYQKDGSAALSPNALWLRTQDDAASLAHIRSALPELQDRRMLITANQENSVHIDILGVLAIGIGAALLLALIGTLLSSWLNASSRLTSFAVMRAIGMAPRQIAAMLLWEQGFIYLLSLLVGVLLGALLILYTSPAVSLLDLAGPGSLYNPYDVPPVQIVVPYQQLLLLLGGLMLICIVALLLTARITTRPSPGQTLRLNED